VTPSPVHLWISGIDQVGVEDQRSTKDDREKSGKKGHSQLPDLNGAIFMPAPHFGKHNQVRPTDAVRWGIRWLMLGCGMRGRWRFTCFANAIVCGRSVSIAILSRIGCKLSEVSDSVNTAMKLRCGRLGIYYLIADDVCVAEFHSRLNRAAIVRAEVSSPWASRIRLLLQDRILT